LILLVDVPNLGIACRALLGIVARTVVNYNNFQVRVRLPQHTLDGFVDEMGLVVTGNDD
jgi:hypothetical protein